MNGVNEVYKVYGLDGRVQEVFLDERERLAGGDSRCPRCGSRFVVFSSDPHNVTECPVCRFHPSRVFEYNQKKDVATIKEDIADLHDRLAFQHQLLDTILEKNNVKQLNLQDIAMKQHDAAMKEKEQANG